MTSAPYKIGSAATTAAITTITITPTTASSAGDTIVVASSIASSGFAATGCTDSAGNVYTLLPSPGGSSTTENPTFIFVSPGKTGGSGGGPTAALSTSSTITITWNVSGGSKNAVAIGGSGLAGTDQNPASTSAASGTAASITSSTLTGAAESVVAIEVNGNAGGAGGAWGSGWTTLQAPLISGAGGQYITAACQVVSSTSPVTASFTLGSSSKWCMLLVSFYTAVSVTTSSLPGGSVGTSYGQTLNAQGGKSSSGYTWSVTAGSLPPGLTLSSGGTVGGTPATPGSYSFTVQAADTLGNTATQPLSITVTATFPADPLDARVELGLGAWTNISQYILQRDGDQPAITITRGRADETASATPSTTSMQWNNRDGRFSPRNPTGPYYGELGRNTPLRISVPRPDGLSYLSLEDSTQGSWASTLALQNSTTLDVRVDMDPSSFTPGIIASQGLSPLWYLQRYGDGTIALWWLDNSAVRHGQSTVIPVPAGRIMLRAVLTLSTGSVAFYTAPTMGGTQTLLSSFTGSGATTVAYVAGDSLYCGGTPTYYSFPAFTGRIYEMQVWDGSTLLADPQFYSQAPGTTVFTDAQANTWTVQNAGVIDDRAYRFYGECSALPQQWDPSGTDVWTPVSASGILRRLQQGSAQVQSVIRRLFTNWPASVAGGEVTAYWPWEDPQGATFIASGLPGGTPARFTVAPSFQGQAGSLSSDSDWPASAGLPTLNGSAVTALVPPVTGIPAANSIGFFMLVPSGGDTNDVGVVQIKTTGTIATYEITYGTAAGGTLVASIYNAAGQQLGSTQTVCTGINGVPILWTMWLSPDGTGVDYGMEGTATNGSGEGFGGFYTEASASIGQLTQILINPTGNLSGTKFGQLVAGTFTFSEFSLATFLNADQYTSLSDINPVSGWAGEPAGARFARLCAENNIQGRVYGYPDTTMTMGAQPIDTLANLLQYCETTDRGIIGEPEQVLGLTYRTLASLQNQAPKVTLNYAAANLGGDGGQGLVPTDDDQYLVNDVTVSRNGGSSAQVQVTSGPLSIQPPPDGAGDYSTSITAYNENDSDLTDIAGWISHVGTTNQERYPTVPLNLARPQLASLLGAIVATDLGDHIQITNPPAWLPPGNIDQLVYGSTEKLGGFWWLLSWNTVPELPYEVAVGGTTAANSAHADTAGSLLTAPVSPSATSLDVITTLGPQWTTSAGDFPFGIAVGGEEMTVSNITAGSGGLCRVGAFLDPGAMQAAGFAAALTQWTGFGLYTPASCRYFLAASTFTYDTNMQAMVADGIKICLTIRPAYNPVSATDLANLTTLLQTLTTAGAVVDVCIWHEPFYEGLTIQQYQNAVRYYGPTVREYYPLVFVTSVQSVQNNSENSYYPGDQWVDKCATDFYAYDYITSDYTLDLAAAPANDAVPPKPFGLWEMGASTDPLAGQNSTQISNYFSYVTAYFQARAAAGMANADLLFFNSGEYNLLGIDGTGNTGFEGSVGTWTASGGSVTDTNAQHHTGSWSAELTASGSGNAALNQPSGTSGIPVTPNTVYTVAGWFKAAATARSCQAGVDWYTSSGTFISSSFPGATTDGTSSFTQNAETVTAPSTAAYAQPVLQVESPAASENHYIDDAVFGAQSADTTVIGFGDGSSPSSDPRIALLNSLHTALDDTSVPQVFTVTRSVNGVVKAQASGTAVALFHTPIAALA